jgi:hypothetical protein
MTPEDDFAALAPPSAVRSNPRWPRSVSWRAISVGAIEWRIRECGFVALGIDGCPGGVQAQGRRPHTWTGVWVSDVDAIGGFMQRAPFAAGHPAVSPA